MSDDPKQPAPTDPSNDPPADSSASPPGASPAEPHTDAPEASSGISPEASADISPRAQAAKSNQDVDDLARTLDADGEGKGEADDGSAAVSADIDNLLSGGDFGDPDSPGAARASDGQSGGGIASGAGAVMMPNFEKVLQEAQVSGIDLLRDVNLEVKIELGRSRLLVEDVLKLVEGSVVELDKLAGDPVDVFVNDRLVARGEVLVLNENFCVRVNEIIQSSREEDL